MTQVLRYPTVVIGSGFAGRTVASHLASGSFMILERGENRPYADSLKRFERASAEGLAAMDAQEQAYASSLPFNQVPRLSKWNYSRFAFIRGGASNWWGGKATRLSTEVFAAQGELSWPFSESDLQPWYEKAERRLNISGDPANLSAPAEVTMPGVDYWRNAFSPYFKGTYIYNTALNHNPESRTTQGRCAGRANCAVCHEDAKARPDNIFEEHPILFETMALSIEFKGERAVAVECFDGKQLFRVEFDRLVLACNGAETPRLLARSDLPPGVRKEQIGAHLQDHAHLGIACKMDKSLLYGNVGGLAHITVGEISGMYDTCCGRLEVSALALTHEPRQETFKMGMDIGLLRQRGPAAFLQDLSGCFDIFCELEIPPHAGISVDLESDEPQVKDDAYEKLIPAFDEITRQMVERLTRLGITVLGVDPVYRNGYGGHHFVGTTNCSDGDKSVVDRDFRVIGTDNVYIAGASVIPRAGGVAPTLTLVALAEKLGEHLAGQEPPAWSRE